VIYAVTNITVADPQQRVNTFLHVNHAADTPRYGVLLCLNGAGSSYRWLRQSLSLTSALSYQALNTLADQAPAGAEGLIFFPFGNGAERMLSNRSLGASFHGLDFNRHGPAHLARAVQEGVAFAMAYGLDSLRSLGLEINRLRAATSNMFLSDVFTHALAGASGATIELRQINGAIGAALGAGYGSRLFSSLRDAVGQGEGATVEASRTARADYAALYQRWCAISDNTSYIGASDG
jgi:xylulokinase